MPLSGGHELLAAAGRGGYAVPGFNVSNIEMIRGVVASTTCPHQDLHDHALAGHALIDHDGDPGAT